MPLSEHYAVTISGTGSWGTALGVLLARNGHRCCLWGNETAAVTALEKQRENSTFLPGITFPDNLQLSGKLEQIIPVSDVVLVAIPSHALRSHFKALKPLLPKGTGIACASKGLEPDTSMLPHQVAEQILGKETPFSVVSGPTFAKEVASDLPTAVTVASSNHDFATKVSELLQGNQFRAYTSSDVVGVELGGAVKNVLAIAAGICDGLGFGANSRAAVITRGLSELMRLGEAVGGKRETFMGLAGVGDLVLTCTDNQSRNRRLGLALGQGDSCDKAAEEIGQVVEGIRTAREVRNLAQRHSIEMPITEQVYRVLYENVSPQDAVRALLTRAPKKETI